MLLPVGPDEFHRVQFRRIGRKVLLLNPALQTSDVVLDQPTAVPRQTVPHQQQRQAQVSYQGLKKVQHLRLLDRTGIQTKVEVPQREPGGYRQALPVEVVLQDGGLPARCPGATAMRSLAQATFVEED